ncbi:GntR family transcriptional regulator [Geodermatophilus sp. URMC 64]
MTGSEGGHLPLYRRVRQVLAERIATGEYRAGDKLPSEPVLAAELGVHRLTVRRALEELAREGLLHARQGAGTFVTQQPSPIAVTIPLSREEFFTSLRSQLEAEGQRYRDVLISTEHTENDAVRGELRYPRGRLRRVDSRLEVNGEPWVCSTAWGPDAQLEDVAARWRETDGVYGLLLDRADGPLRYVWRSFGAEAASAEDADQLGIRVGAPVLVREGLTADALGTPVLRIRRRARGDRVRYVLEYSTHPLRGSGPAG